jgi:hypothetical protein
VTNLNRAIDSRDREIAREYAAFLKQMLSVNRHPRKPPAVLSIPTRKPNGLSLSDWRMALRRKLNGDTR